MTALLDRPQTSPASPTPPSAPPKRRSRRRWRIQLWHVLLLPLAFAWVYPFLWMVSAGFKTQNDMYRNGASLIPEEFTLDNFVRAWTVGRFGEYTWNTVVFSITVVVLVVLVAAPAGWALSRPTLKGRKVILVVLAVSMFIPSGYTIIPTFVLVNWLGLGNGLLGAALAQAGPSLVVPVLLYVGFFSQIPKELTEAAQVDGAGYFRTFFSVVLPLAKPVTGTVVLLNFVFAWNAFFIPLIFTLGNPMLRTLGVGMYGFFGTNTSDWTGLAAAATISVLPVVVVFLFLQRYFIEGIAGAVKS